jgi:hypothetical protein
MKKRLENEKDAFGHSKVHDIGSKIYINEFAENTNKCIYKYPFQNTNLIKFNTKIYLKNIKKWQYTEEYIFKKVDLKI